MTQLADRVGGVFFIVFGLVLYLFIIPAQTEPAESGWVFPQTIPNVIAWLLCLLGAWLVIRPSIVGGELLDTFPKATLFLLVILVSVISMSYAGFVWIAPPLALAIMLLKGERRKLWLVVGSVVMPALIWLLVVPVLERVLP